MSIQPARTITERALMATVLRDALRRVARRTHLRRSFQRFQAGLEQRLRSELRRDHDEGPYARLTYSSIWEHWRHHARGARQGRGRDAVIEALFSGAEQGTR